MKLNQVPNFRVEDFKTEESWIGRFFVLLNPFIQSLSQVLDQNIDFSTNIPSVVKTYSTTITQFIPFSFSWSFASPPVSVQIFNATKGNQAVPTILLLAWSYNSTQKNIQISRMVEVNDTSISALSGKYNFSIRATV